MLLHYNEIDRSKNTSAPLAEYMSFKDENLDCIILFQVGTFFETFFEDAKILSDLTGMALRPKSYGGVGKIAQCGFSISKNNYIYIKELLNAGYKICLCQEFQDNEGKFYRKLTRKFTKGTIIENEFLELSENNYILALNKTQENVQIAYADVSTGQFYKTTGSINEAILEAQKIEPSEVLVFENQVEYFSEILDTYNTTLLTQDFKEENIEATIEKYCSYTQKDFCAKLDKIIEYDIHKYLIMDEITRKNLELTRTKMLSKHKGSLIWFLNNTKTPMGTRLLKKYLSEPLLNVEDITLRQEAIDELIKDENNLNKLKDILGHFCDLSRICAHLSNSTILPRDLYRMAQNSNEIKELNSTLKSFKSDLLKIDEQKFNQITDTTSEIQNAIKKDASDKLKEGGIIKEDYCAELDYLRENLSTYEKQIELYEKKLQQKLKIEKLKIITNNHDGFYIEITPTHESKIPQNFLLKQRITTATRYVNEELTSFEDKIFKTKYKIVELERKLYCKLREEAKQFIEIIRQLAQEIARIDVLTSLAHCAKINNFTKPKFNSKTLKIKQGYHPSLIKLRNKITKNDTNIDNGTMIILTGANMSGKSTYLKHNAIICLLAQMGSFIPADDADLTIVDKIFLRQGATDDIINNNSSFMVEMNDFKFIIDNITDSSLILLDEPAKSTNAREGGAIAHAFCDYLINHYNTKTILATHNFELTKLERNYPQRAINYVIGSSDISELVPTNRSLRKGIVESSLAINTAILANLPDEIIQNAKAYSQG